MANHEFIPDDASLELPDERIDVNHVMLKTYSNFNEYFTDDIQKLRAVTYSESPEMIIDVYDKIQPDTMEVLIGDRTVDLQEQLRDKEELAIRLVELLEQDKLKIYKTDNSDVHAKLYILEKENGRTTIRTSANLSKNGWVNSRQKNHATIYHSSGNSTFDEQKDKEFEEFMGYGELFMDNLLRDVEEAEDTEEKIQHVQAFVQGRNTNIDEETELQRKLTDELKQVDADVEQVGFSDEADVKTDGSVGVDERIQPSLNGFDDIQDSIRNHSRSYDDINVTGQRLEMPAGTVSEYANDRYGAPKMFLKDDELILQKFDGSRLAFDREWSEDKQDVIRRSLEQIEEYIETVDRFGNTNNPEAVKAQMYEVVLWFFWSPFSEDYAEEYRRRDIDLDKYIKDLYLLGETNSGKGTLVNYVLSLMSDGVVDGMVDGDELGKRTFRSVRRADTRFPIVFDDVSASDVNNEVYLNFREKHWADNGVSIPAVGFVSNHKLPKARIQNRLKTIELSVQFENNASNAEEISNLINRTNPVYGFFAEEFQNRDVAVPEDSDDILVEARNVMLDLYEFASFQPPSYFPEDTPAEVKYDMGKQKWKNAYQNDLVDFEQVGENLVASFDENVSSYKVRRFAQHLNGNGIRPNAQGNQITIKSPESAKEWFPFTIENGFLSKTLSKLN